MLTEERRWTFRPVHEHAWRLGLRLRLSPAGDDSADPWFVRHAGYPGVGLALAWDRAVTTTTARPAELQR